MPRKCITREEMEPIIALNLPDRETAAMLGRAPRYMTALRLRHGFPPRKIGRPVGSRNSPEAVARQVASFKRNRGLAE